MHGVLPFLPDIAEYALLRIAMTYTGYAPSVTQHSIWDGVTFIRGYVFRIYFGNID